MQGWVIPRHELRIYSLLDSRLGAVHIQRRGLGAGVVGQLGR
jgi:hypothetical protein